MIDVVTIAGSPSHPSKSSATLQYARAILAQHGLESAAIIVRDLPAEDLVYGRLDSAASLESIALIRQSQAIVIATPVCKAAYAGVLKAFLDLLPHNVLLGKIVLPIATGGSPTHLLALDYALKPVLAALGAQHILHGIYILDDQIRCVRAEDIQLDGTIDRRLRLSLEELATHVMNRTVLQLA